MEATETSSGHPAAGRLALACAIALAACASSEEGNVLHVSLAPGGDPAPGCPAACEVLGGTVSLREAWVAVTSVEIVPCPGTTRRLLRFLDPLPAALAHGEGTPTRTSVPGGVDLLGDAEIAIGELAPPAGRYCSVRVVYGPPDEHAVGLPAPSLEGKTLVLRGPELDRITSGSRAATVELAAPLDMRTRTEGVLLVRVGADGWLAGVDPASSIAAEDALAAIAAGTSAGVEGARD